MYGSCHSLSELPVKSIAYSSSKPEMLIGILML